MWENTDQKNSEHRHFSRSVRLFKNSTTEMFSKKDVLENLTKVTRKHLCQSLFFNKVVDQPVTLFKKDSGTGVFL